MNILETILSHNTVLPMEKLTDITVTEDTNCLELDMTGNRWAEFNFVFLLLTPKSTATTEFVVRVNDLITNATCKDVRSNGSYVTMDLAKGSWKYALPMLFFVAHGGGKGMDGISMYQTMWHSHSELPADEITKLSFGLPTDTELNVKAGTRLEIWGIL